MTIKSTIIDNSKIIFCNKNTQRYACYKNMATLSQFSERSRGELQFSV